MIVIGFRAAGIFFKENYKECRLYNRESGKTFQGTLFLFSFFNTSFLKAKAEKVKIFL